jgi:hypothetical protein
VVQLLLLVSAALPTQAAGAILGGAAAGLAGLPLILDVLRDDDDDDDDDVTRLTSG